MAQQFQRKVIDAVAVTTNSAAIDASNMWSVSLQAVATGSAAGSAKLQASNDSPIGSAGQNGGTWAPTNWSDISGATVALNGVTPVIIPKTDVCYQFIRVVMTISGGTGTATANLKAISV